MAYGDDVTRIRLPHTGLRVPDKQLSITAYKAGTTDDGTWFQANININGKLVGQVTNEGLGEPTTLYADEHLIYGDVDVALDGYRRYCRTEEGERLTNLEHLLDELISEHEWTLKVADAAKKGRTPLRLMAYVIEELPPCPAADTTSALLTHPKQWRVLREALNDNPKFTPEPGVNWWQAWWQNRWQDATRRPSTVKPDLYG